MSISNQNNAERLSGLLLLLHAAEVEDHDETSFFTPPRLIKTVRNKSTHAPERPSKRYQPDNPNSAFSQFPLKKRWKEGSRDISSKCPIAQGLGISIQSPIMQGSPTKVKRVTCSQPNNHIIWENAACCQHALIAASPFRSRHRSSSSAAAFNYFKAQGALKGADTTAVQESRSLAFRHKILEDVRRKMDF
jgi:hypothetical protein